MANLDRPKLALIGTFTAYLIGALTATCAGTVWLLELFEVPKEFSHGAFVLIVISLGLILPGFIVIASTLFLYVGKTEELPRESNDPSVTQSVFSKASDALMERSEKLEDQISKLEDRILELSTNLERSQSLQMKALPFGKAQHCKDMVVHFLDQCRDSIQFSIGELTREKGRNLSKAKEDHRQSLKNVMEICLRRFQREKAVLKGIDPTDESGLIHQYLIIKEGVIDACRRAENILGTKAAASDTVLLSDLIRQATNVLVESSGSIGSGIAHLSSNVVHKN